MANPAYDGFIALPRWIDIDNPFNVPMADQYRKTHDGKDPAGTDIGHGFWRLWFRGEKLKEIWAPEDPSQPPPPGVDLQGRLRVAGGGFQDDSGFLLPCFCHFGEAFSAYIRRPADIVEQLKAVRKAGYDGIRFWDILGWYNEWRGREVTPIAFTGRDRSVVKATPAYYRKLEDFLIVCRELGLRVHHSRGDLNGLSPNDVVDHSAEVKRIYDKVGLDVLALYEGNNEDWHNGSLGPANLRRVVAWAKDKGVLTALSHRSEELADLKQYASGDLFYVHGYRSGQSTDRIRHIFSVAYEAKNGGYPRLGWQGEPVGPGSSVHSVDDPEELALLAAQSWMSRQAWCYMSGFGVWWNGRLERQPGFYAVAAMRAWLTEHGFNDVPRFQQLVHGGRPAAKLVSPDGYYDPDENTFPNGPNRIDQALAGRGRIMALIHGNKGTRRIQNRSGQKLQVWIGQPTELSVLTATRELRNDEVMSVTYRVGRVILARPA